MTDLMTPPPALPIRPASPADLDPLARLWQQGWNDAHAAFVPPDLLQYRTLNSFRARLDAYGDRLRTAGPPGTPLGLCAIKPDELDQLYVAPDAQGTGLAARLLADGETRLAAQGTTRAHLLCLKENARAARFYERQGWSNLGVREEALDTAEGPYPIKLFRFEKSLDLA